MMNHSTLIRFAGIAFSFVAFAGAAGAQDFPTRPITMIEPWEAGTSGDITARIVAEFASEKLGQPIAVQNIAGGGGAKAMLTLSEADPDGYTIGNSWVATQIMVPTFESRIGFEPMGFDPIALMWVNPFTLTVTADHPANNVDEFVEWAKAQDGILRVGVCPAVSLPHVVMRRFLEVAGITNYQPIPADGCETSNIQGLFDGSLDFTTGALGAEKTYGDKIKSLAIFTEERSPIEPEIPTAKEQGYDLDWGAATAGWSGLVAPEGTDPERLKVLQDVFRDVINSEAFKKKMFEGGFTVQYMEPEEFKDLWRVSLERLGPALDDLKKN
ncbi:tripartite tricarboxylate transporter substrate binding protein [Chelativorans sp. M5D2P16]|uniref:Bug family tripartite tricarboxylate transporter substrate binding protein n=1 Tax=Chelativorans sp. M5D2P16 TaxID=3095678 RepID=UPI002ACAEFDA|nr:tripartite tricarboxylate transporter substrate binding protein [Chelativorans sp. M5D2P16]MDZ5699478.1 tripartite tricarboxylate transporter substrate binding protein [Chelativorans sp. M5D2P16]